MDTLSNPPTPDADTRLADLERQLAGLRGEVDALAAGLEHAFAAGRASVLESSTARSRQAPRHLQLVVSSKEASACR